MAEGRLYGWPEWIRLYKDPSTGFRLLCDRCELEGPDQQMFDAARASVEHLVQAHNNPDFASPGPGLIAMSMIQVSRRMLRMQHRRILASTDEEQMRCDLLIFAWAARQWLRAAEAYSRALRGPERSRVDNSLGRFKKAIPPSSLRHLRNALEHFDSYDLSVTTTSSVGSSGEVLTASIEGAWSEEGIRVAHRLDPALVLEAIETAVAELQVVHERVVAWR